MSTARWIVAVSLVALVLPLVASDVAGDAGITETLPATVATDPSPTPAAPPSSRLPTVTAPTSESPTLPGGHPDADRPPPTPDPAANDSPTSVGSPATTPTGESADPEPPNRTTPDGSGGARPSAPSGGPLGPGPAASPPAHADRSVPADPIRSAPEGSQVAPRTGSSSSGLASGFLSLTLLGAIALLVGLRLSSPSPR